ncbi:MAG: hypothetical protein RL235_965 [Chlamydiota bacterium]|jgi:DNA repair protein RecO
MHQRTSGVLLTSVPYLGKARILKVFTPEHGLIGCIAKRSIDPAFTTPFCIGEWVYAQGRKELHYLVDATIIEPLTTLKTRYDLVETAGLIAYDLLQTQLPAKRAEELFRLACVYLLHLHKAKHPKVLWLSFRLKLLTLEGVFDPALETDEALKKLAQCKRASELFGWHYDNSTDSKVHLLFNKFLYI